MKEVAKLQIKDRTELFQATAISMGILVLIFGILKPEAIIYKKKNLLLR